MNRDLPDDFFPLGHNLGELDTKTKQGCGHQAYRCQLCRKVYCARMLAAHRRTCKPMPKKKARR